MQISRMQSYQRSSAGGSQSNPFALNGGKAQPAQTQIDVTQKNHTNQNRQGGSDQARQQELQALQQQLQQEQKDMAKLQQAFQQQLRSLSPQDGAKIANATKSFQNVLGEKSTMISRLNQHISQAASSGSIGGFVGQQAGGSGIGLSVKA